MPLQARDVILVLRAKDEASRVITQVGRSFVGLGDEARLSAARMISAGSALAAFGAGITTLGVGMLMTAKNFAQASMEYQQQAALALTQVDQIGISLEDLKKIGQEVAVEIPVPFEELQGGLYDIFSSLDVNATEAEQILRGFAKGAVAGQVDLQSAGRSTIAILNAFGLGAEDVNRVMDVQFQLVRKGIGTYEDFASTIGLGLPGAVRAGQDIETLSAMLAFLTRNGLSASRAATSAGRALETLANPKVAERLKDMGIAVVDNEGNFRRLEDIVNDMGVAMKDLTDPQRAALLNELFAGAGNTIQARRFWDTAIKNYEEFNQRADEMQNSAGAMQAAYDIMFNQPMTQLELFKNKLKVFRQEVGDYVVADVEKLAGAFQKVADWLVNLSPETKKMIADFLLIGGAITTIVGAATGLSGVLLIFGGMIKMFGGFAGIAAMGLKFFGVLGLIAGAAYLIYKNWDKIKPYWDKYWPKVQEKAEAFLTWLQDTWNKYWPGIKEVLINTLQNIWDWWVQFWPQLRDTVVNVVTAIWDWWQGVWPEVRDFLINVLNGLKDAWDTIWPALQETVQTIYDWIKEHWPEIQATFEAVMEGIGVAIQAIVDFAQAFWDKLVEVYNWVVDTFGPGIEDIWNSLKENLGPILEDIYIIIKDLWDKVWAVVEPAITTIYHFIKDHWEQIRDVISAIMDHILIIVETAWNLVSNAISTALEVIRGILDVFAGLLTGDWDKMWEGIKHIAQGAGDFIVGSVRSFLVGVWKLFLNFMDFIKQAWDLGWEAIKASFELVLGWAENIGEKIVEAVGELGDILYDIGWSIIDGLWQGMKDIWESVENWLGGLAKKIPLKKGPPAVDAKILYENGQLIIQGLQDGMQDQWSSVADWLTSIAPSLADTFSKVDSGISSMPDSLRAFGWTDTTWKDYQKALSDGLLATTVATEDVNKAVGSLPEDLRNAGWTPDAWQQLQESLGNKVEDVTAATEAVGKAIQILPDELRRVGWTDETWAKQLGITLKEYTDYVDAQMKLLMPTSLKITQAQRDAALALEELPDDLRRIGWTAETWADYWAPPTISSPAATLQQGDTTIQIPEGAVKIDVGNVANPDDVDRIQAVVNDAFAQLIRELSQASYGK